MNCFQSRCSPLASAYGHCHTYGAGSNTAWPTAGLMAAPDIVCEIRGGSTRSLPKKTVGLFPRVRSSNIRPTHSSVEVAVSWLAVHQIGWRWPKARGSRVSSVRPRPTDRPTGHCTAPRSPVGRPPFDRVPLRRRVKPSHSSVVPTSSLLDTSDRPSCIAFYHMHCGADQVFNGEPFREYCSSLLSTIRKLRWKTKTKENACWPIYTRFLYEGGLWSATPILALSIIGISKFNWSWAFKSYFKFRLFLVSLLTHHLMRYTKVKC